MVKESNHTSVEARAYARAGLLGNPSDGYFGKTISIIIKNFEAHVSLTTSEALRIEPGPSDLNVYRDIHDLADTVKSTGYYGGARLIKAAVKIFYDFCQKGRIELLPRNFTARYESSIPRQVGLAGSSAIVVAALRALTAFYGVEIPLHVLANMTLAAEKDELGIQAGLQDRVIQVYEGCVYMDFNQDFMEAHGRGLYEPLDVSLLPNLYIAYRTDLGKESGEVHGSIKRRFDAGDARIAETLQRIAQLASEGREALLQKDYPGLHRLMDENFDLRSSIMPISEDNMEMIRTARACGASAKFAGSGGTIVGMFEGERMFNELAKAFGEMGVRMVVPKIV